VKVQHRKFIFDMQIRLQNIRRSSSHIWVSGSRSRL